MSRHKTAQSNRTPKAGNSGVGDGSVGGQEHSANAGAMPRTDSRHPDDDYGAREDARHYQQMFESTSEVVIVAEVTEDARFRVLDCNPAWEMLSGLSRSALIGRLLDESTSHSPGAQETLARCRTCYETGGPVEYVQEFETLGERRWFRTTLIPICDDSGKVYRLVATGRDITEQHLAEVERRAHLHFFESTDRVNSVLQSTEDFEQTLMDLLDLLLSVFECDRAFLIYPCDPDADSWSPVMERTVPEYPTPYPLGSVHPMAEGWKLTFRSLLATGGPVTVGPAADLELPAAAAEEYGFSSAILSAIHPRGDKPYMLGLHQCSYPRVWNREERVLFEAIGRRLGDALTSLLAYRNLTDSEKRLQLILANSPDIIASQDETLRYTWISGPPSLLGQDAIGMTDEELLPPGEARYLMAIKRQVLATGTTYHEEIPSHLTGELRWYDTFIEPMRDDAGNTIGVGYYARDITARKAAEEELRNSEERYRTIFRNAPLGIFRSTPEGRFLEVNPALARLLRFESPEAVIQGIHDIGQQIYMRPEDRVGVLEAHRNTGEFIQHQSRFWRKDGTQFTANLYLRKVADASGNPIYFEGIIEDITDRKQAEDKLVEAAEYARSLIDASPDLFATVSQNGTITDANDAAEMAVGVPRDRLVGSYFATYFTDPERATAGFQRVLKEGSVKDFDLVLRTASGEERSVRFNATARLSPDGELLGVLAIARDMTELEEAASRTRRALRDMVEAIAQTIEMRDPATAGHQRRVCELASAIAANMGLDDAQIEGVQLGATIHDIGKLHIPVEILSKPEPLSEEDWRIIREHPAAGAEVMRGVSAPWPIEQMLLQHHERLDGSGYPRGLTGDEILLESRILAVADVVEAMTSHRPDRPAPGIEAALAEVERGRGTLFDQRVVDACVALFREQRFHFGS